MFIIEPFINYSYKYRIIYAEINIINSESHGSKTYKTM